MAGVNEKFPDGFAVWRLLAFNIRNSAPNFSVWLPWIFVRFSWKFQLSDPRLPTFRTRRWYNP